LSTERLEELVRIVEPPNHIRDLLEGAIAVVRARWSSEDRLIILASFKHLGGVAYIAPPIPSPYCISRLEPAEEAIIKYVLLVTGLKAFSACRVHSTLLRSSVKDTIAEIASVFNLVPIRWEEHN
jgi:hypothetical protein